MEQINNNKLSTEKNKNNQHYFDCVSVLNSECDLISGIAAELDSLAMSLDILPVDREKFIHMEKLADSVYKKIYKIYKTEDDYIFPEMNLLTPWQSALDAMRAENNVIMNEYIPIRKLLNNRKNINTHK